MCTLDEVLFFVGSRFIGIACMGGGDLAIGSINMPQDG